MADIIQIDKGGRIEVVPKGRIVVAAKLLNKNVYGILIRKSRDVPNGYGERQENYQKIQNSFG